MISLKPYQETKVDELIKAVSDLIILEAQNKICVFQSPTGSGTTGLASYLIGNRYYIGIELNVKFCELTIKRLNKYSNGLY
jgi:site-specific DNA-methyltransferase (adenine-specific)